MYLICAVWFFKYVFKCKPHEFDEIVLEIQAFLYLHLYHRDWSLNDVENPAYT